MNPLAEAKRDEQDSGHDHQESRLSILRHSLALWIFRIRFRTSGFADSGHSGSRETEQMTGSKRPEADTAVRYQRLKVKNKSKYWARQSNVGFDTRSVLVIF